MMDMEERLTALRDAQRKVLESAEILERALHMSGLEQRFGRLPSQLREIASSPDSDSISNLIRETEYLEEEHPGWTRPFASPKNITRKDI